MLCESSNETLIIFYVSLPKSGTWRCLFDFSVMFFFFFITLMTWNTDYSKSLICWALWIVFYFPWDLRNTANLIIVMDSHSNLCWAHSDTVFFWDRLEKKARLALIVYAHINKQIYHDLSFICSHCLIPSVNSPDWMHLRVFRVLSSCVCVPVRFTGRRRQRHSCPL